MKVSKFIGIAVLFTALGVGIAGHNSTESVSAKTKITSTKYDKKTPARIESSKYHVYSYPRALKSSSKFMHYGSSRHSTTFYITKTIKLSNGQSYSWLADRSGKGYGYINKKAITVYASPKTDNVDYNHTPVRIKSSGYDVYSYPKALHGNAKLKHYGTSYHSQTFFVSKNVTTVNNVKYAKLTYGGGTVYGYINAKAIQKYATLKDIRTVTSKKRWYTDGSGSSDVFNHPIYTTFGAKKYSDPLYYNGINNGYVITKTETRAEDGAKFAYIKEADGPIEYDNYTNSQRTKFTNIGWVHTSSLTDRY